MLAIGSSFSSDSPDHFGRVCGGVTIPFPSDSICTHIGGESVPTLYRLGFERQGPSGNPRRSNVATTLGYYVKPDGRERGCSDGKLEQETAVQILRDCDGTAKPASGANPRIRKLPF
jgi:hypothetical protein